MLIKKLSERIFFCQRNCTRRWILDGSTVIHHEGLRTRLTTIPVETEKTVTTASASLDTCESATRALDSENIEANVARGAFLFSPGRSFYSRRFSPSRGIIRSALYSSFPRKGPSPVKVSRLFEPDNHRIEQRQESCALHLPASPVYPCYTPCTL